ncbi:hypothetical protein QQX98_011256 [Neonectria punicea]|uniref:Uncharacterized protein n=1 Tax=Neonectria punicea TaxID=979145 RepID=A0ABR1GML8_9HYPO
MDANVSLLRLSGHERASLPYTQWKDDFKTEKPYEIISQVPEGCPQKNFTLGPAPEQVIHDLRGQESEFNLNDNGFEVRRNEISMTSFGQDDVESHYLPAIKPLLQDVDPGSEVDNFDWRLRSSDKNQTKHEQGARIDLNDQGLVLAPVHAVHNGSSHHKIKTARQSH